MTHGNWLQTATLKLNRTSTKSARLDALLILEKVTSFSRTRVLAYPEKGLSDTTLNKLNKMLEKRLNGEPMAYILSNKEFYGRDFFVNKNVLIPRPESETIISLLKKYLAPNSRVQPVKVNKLVDVGTGSGCLAITAKLELPELDVEACDILKKAIEIAKKNAKHLQANINFFESNLLENSTHGYDIILANLPYVPDNLVVSSDVKAEPKLAVFSGVDGLYLMEKFLAQLENKLAVGGLVFIECLEMQHPSVTKLAEEKGLKLLETENLIQIFIRM